MLHRAPRCGCQNFAPLDWLSEQTSDPSVVMSDALRSALRLRSRVGLCAGSVVEEGLGHEFLTEGFKVDFLRVVPFVEVTKCSFVLKTEFGRVIRPDVGEFFGALYVLFGD